MITLPKKKNEPVHVWVYNCIRQAIMEGVFVPGEQLTLRKMAELLEVSVMPVREAIRQLVAERALEFLDSRRVKLFILTQDKIDELFIARLALESAAITWSFDSIDKKLTKKLAKIDECVNQAILLGNVKDYILYNQMFHFSICFAKPSEALQPLIESLWLQMAPSMRLVFGRVGTSKILDEHAAAIDAIKRQNLADLLLAIEADLLTGRELMKKSLLENN